MKPGGTFPGDPPWPDALTSATSDPLLGVRSGVTPKSPPGPASATASEIMRGTTAGGMRPFQIIQFIVTPKFKIHIPALCFKRTVRMRKVIVTVCSLSEIFGRMALDEGGEVHRASVLVLLPIGYLVLTIAPLVVRMLP